MQLVDKDGNLHEVAPENVTKALASGQLGFIQGEPVHLVTPGGDVRKFAPEHAAQALAAGARVASKDEARDAHLQNEYGGLGGELAAGGEGAARGISLGLSDPLAVGTAKLLGGDQAGEEVRHHLASEKEANPIASTTGEVAGALAPILLTDGSAAGAEGSLGLGARAAGGVRSLGFLPRVADGAGALAADITEKLIGTEAEGVLGRAAQKGIAQAARGIVEGGLWGAGNEISDSTLKNQELTSEHMLTAVTHGALMAGAVSGGLSGLGSVLGDAASKIAEYGQPALKDLGETQAWRSISGRKAFQKELDRVPGGENAMGRMLLDDGLVQTGDNVEQSAERINAARKTEGANIGRHLDEADAAGAEGPTLLDMRSRVRSEVLPELEKMGETNAGAIGRVNALLNDLGSFTKQVHGLPAEADANGLRLTFRAAQDFRKRVDDQIKWATNPLAPVNETTEALKGVRDALEQSIVDAGENAADKLGPEWKNSYGAAKARYQKLIVADRAAQDTVQRFHANAALSLTDKLAASSALNAGLMHGLSGAASGQALGALAAGGVHGLVLGALTGAASKLIRTRGASTSAVLLDKLSTFEGMSAAANDVIERTTAAISSALTSRPDREAPKEKNSETAYDDARDRVEKLAAMSPAAMRAHLDDQTAGLATHAPGVAQGVADKAINANAFLASKLPPLPDKTSSLTPHLIKDTTSPAERAKFMRYVHAVEGGPPAILRRLARGQMSLEDAETMKAVFPATFEDVRQRVMSACAERKKPLPLQSALRLGTLFDVATCPELDPQFVIATGLAMQAASPKPPPPPGKEPKKTGGGAKKGAGLAETIGSEFEKAASAA